MYIYASEIVRYNYWVKTLISLRMVNDADIGIKISKWELVIKLWKLGWNQKQTHGDGYPGCWHESKHVTLCLVFDSYRQLHLGKRLAKTWNRSNPNVLKAKMKRKWATNYWENTIFFVWSESKPRNAYGREGECGIIFWLWLTHMELKSCQDELKQSD